MVYLNVKYVIAIRCYKFFYIYAKSHWKYHTFEGYYICSFSKLRYKVHQKVWECSPTFPLQQWCTTSGPRATSGPRQVVKWPARPNRKSTISDTALTLKPTHLDLISQHLNDFKLRS